MALTRRLDEEAVALQRQGELVAFAPLAGQEAAQVASAYALEEGDFAFPSYRDLGVAVARGVDLVAYLQAYRGIWNGGMYDPRDRGFAPIASSVGSHVLHAVGWAMGTRMDRRDRVAIAYFGEGATSEGDISEAFNFAGVFGAPVIFFCQNNRWAISMPAERQTAGEIWRRAEGFGIAGVRIDGNDAVEVHRATMEAAARARRGRGATLIEAMTYRIGPHSTADDATRYRAAADVEPWKARDPIERLRRLIGDDAAFYDAVEEQVRTRVGEIRAGITSSRHRPPAEMFDFVYAAPPPHLADQRMQLKGLQSGHGEGSGDA